MFSKGSAPTPRRLIALIAGITIVPLLTLLWLGWRLLDQDRLLENQQIQQRVGRAADLVVAALERPIAASEQGLSAGGGSWPDGAVEVTFHSGRVDVSPRERVAYLPVVPPLPEVPATTFADGEDLEFRQRDLAAAMKVYRGVASSADPAVRAGALLRLARALRQDGRAEEAGDIYSKLSTIDRVSSGGVPAALIANYARGKLLEEQQHASDLHALGADLDRDIRSGRWALTEPVYRLYAADTARWSGRLSQTPPQAEILAGAIGALWDRWTSTPPPSHSQSGRESLEVEGQQLVVLWQASEDSFRALVAMPAFVEAEWIPAIAPVIKEQHISFGLRDVGGTQRFGTVNARDPYKAIRNAAESALPWTVVTASLDPPEEDRTFALRRRLLIAGLVVLVSMALLASYLIVRAVSRELAVARLQSDFVSAVSHEFRTPLTALRQFTDMLREQPRLGEDRRGVAYEAQSRAIERLTNLVESLLDFGRMEAGTSRYQFEPQDCSELVRHAVEDFRSEAKATGHDIDFLTNGPALTEVDNEALTRAVRNLLDNAVKSSPEPSPLEVGLERRNGDILITVRDRGIGIPTHEQAGIFAKFQRGEQARRRGIKGTGIGLAMVDEIVKAHHGRVEVESEPGKGMYVHDRATCRG